LEALVQQFVETAIALDAEDKLQSALGTLAAFTAHIPQNQRLSLMQPARVSRSLNFDPEAEVADQASNHGRKMTADEVGG
jgi:hypothetical protein